MLNSPGLAFFRAQVRTQTRNVMVRSAGVLVGGTALGHAISAVSLPIVTRLYEPADMSVLAVFANLLGIVYVAICLRFDIAVPIAHQDEDAVNLLALGALCALVLSVALGAIIGTLPEHWVEALGISRFYLLLLPVATFVAGLYSLLQYWFVRRRSFNIIATSRISQSAASAGAQIGFGAFGIAPAGLIVGHMLNSGFGAFVLGARLWRGERQILRSVNWERMRAMWRAHDRFPKYSAAEALTNSASISLPVILIAALAAGPEAGHLTLAMMIIQAPMSLIGTAVAQVYISTAPERHRAGILGQFTSEVVANLVKVGVGPLLFIGMVAPFAFGEVFGPEWTRSGVLVAWMTPWFIMQFLATPVAMALMITGRQRSALVLQICGLVLRVGAVTATGLIAARWISESYALSGFFFYALYLAVILVTVGASVRAIARGLASAKLFLLGWIASAVAIDVVLAILGATR